MSSHGNSQRVNESLETVRIGHLMMCENIYINAKPIRDGLMNDSSTYICRF